MRVTNQNLTGASTAGTSGAQDVQRSGGSPNSGSLSGAGGDRVELSSTLGSLSRAMEAFEASRQSMVQSITAQYQSGSYQADSAAVSHSLVSEALSR